MIESSKEQLYCSVDLEFTGFDPSRDQILEIGFAFFRMTENGAEVAEQWSQVFKSSIEVHPKILGLTGITLEELDAAPTFDEHREFIQQKLGDAIIVGHNPTMDVKFLESYGIKLSGQTIDTLELVQFLLPTHHSYNLENLVHYFGVKHGTAHRALGDSLSTIAVLEHLMRIFQGFDEKLREQILQISERGQFLWAQLLNIPLAKESLPTADSLSHLTNTATEALPIDDGLVTIDALAVHHESRVANGLVAQNQNTVLVIEDVATVMRLWKAGLVHGLFSPEDVFNPDAFAAFLDRAITPEELRFCLKIIVWQATNWQTETVFDLNISFFGGQFRSSVVGGQQLVPETKIVCADYRTFDQLSRSGIFKNRQAVICNLQGFEKFISTGNGTRTSWSSLLYLLRMIYNPETDFGNKAAKDAVLAALIGIDLFFALAYMLLHKAYPQAKYVSLADLEREQSYLYNRLLKAAESLRDKLEDVLNLANSSELARAVEFLGRVFVAEPGQVRWVSLDETNTSFHDQPLDVSGVSKKILANCQSYHFTDTLIDERLLSYLVERLGLSTELNKLSNISASTLSNRVNIQPAITDNPALLNVLEQAEFPVLVAFPEHNQVKLFYNEHYTSLKKHSAVFAQGYSGGGNKMFRNFSIRARSILLATPEFVAKQSYSLPARTALFAGLPIIEDAHPYIQALAIHFQASFPDLHQLLVKSKLIEVLKKITVAENLAIQLFLSASEASEFAGNPPRLDV